MARSSLFWHVPYWFNLPPGGASFSVGNSDDNCVAELLETETASDSIAPDRYWVERIVGQYQLHMNTDVVGYTDSFFHHRVYVAQAGSGYIQLRDPSVLEDADTSFLMHKVEYHHDRQVDNGGGSGNGSWGFVQPLDSASGTVYWNGAPAAAATRFNGPISRQGGFDIKVGRVVDEGESLIWHTKAKSNISWADSTNDWGLRLWVRLLIRQL